MPSLELASLARSVPTRRKDRPQTPAPAVPGDVPLPDGLDAVPVPAPPAASADARTESEQGEEDGPAGAAGTAVPAEAPTDGARGGDDAATPPRPKVPTGKVRIGRVGLVSLLAVGFVTSAVFSAAIGLVCTVLVQFLASKGVIDSLNELLGGLMTINAGSLIELIWVTMVALAIVGTLIIWAAGLVYNGAAGLVGGLKVRVDDEN